MIIKNIQKVEYIEPRFLKGLTIVPGKGVLLNMWRFFKEIDTIGLSSATVSDKVVLRNRIFYVKLVATLNGDWRNSQPLCFRITTVMGEQFLLGTEAVPYPIVTTVDNFPSAVTDKSGTTLTVEYSNTFGLLPILDS